MTCVHSASFANNARRLLAYNAAVYTTVNMQSTITALRSRVRSLGASAGDGKNIVAFSGGVDSSLVAALVHHVFPGSSQACVGVSSALPTAQLDLARSVASHIGERPCARVR